MDAITSTITRILSAPSTALSTLLRPMDTIFNIPLVSVLLLPSLSSWSTSFNVLFFYATWSLLLLSHPPLSVEFLGTLLVRLVFFVAPSTLFLLIDTTLPFVMRSIKQHGDAGIATSAVNGGLDPRTGMWWRVAGLALFNIVLGVALQTGIDWFLTSVLRTRSALVVSTSLPLPWAIIKNLAAAWALRELVSYVGHRYLCHCDDHSNSQSPLNPHHRGISKTQSATTITTTTSRITTHLTSCHNRVYHSLRAPLPFSAHYDHPLPYLIRVFLPDYLPAALLRMHLLTYHLWLALISVEEALVHSNYAALPTGLLLGGMARRAERHLAGGGSRSTSSSSSGGGNYGAYGILDLLMGTSLGDEGPADFGDDVLEDAIVEAQRRGLPQRATRKGREIVREKMGVDVGRRKKKGADYEEDDDEEYREEENGMEEESGGREAIKGARQRRSTRRAAATARSRS